MKKSISFIFFFCTILHLLQATFLEEFLRTDKPSLFQYKADGTYTLGINIDTKREYPIHGELRALISVLMKKHKDKSQENYTIVWKETKKVSSYDESEKLINQYLNRDQYLDKRISFIAIKDPKKKQILFFIEQTIQDPQLLICMQTQKDKQKRKKLSDE